MKSTCLRRVACGLAFGAALFCRAQSPVVIRLSPSTSGKTISPDFVGLSFEMQYVLAVANGSHFFSPANKPLVAIFKTLGVRSLRVGGNTADRPALPTPGKTDVDNLFAFAKTADVKVIYTLRLNQGSLDAAVEMANYIMRRYSKQLACFAIGNEPNVFSKEYAPYLAEWKRYAAEITLKKNSPRAKFCGPSTSPGHEKWSADFANEFGTNGPLAFISQHDYPGGDARRATNAAAAREKILSPAIDEHYAKFSANFVPAVLSNGLPYRLEEANSFYDGGALDVSDTFGSSLWALDYQWWWLEHGASGINFHTGDKVAARDESKPCRYAVFWTSPYGYDVHPIGYALKLFSMGARGSWVSPVVENTDNVNLAVYAAATGEQQYSVTLINREQGASGPAASVVLEPSFTKAHARVMFLTAPDNDSAAKKEVTLGGAEIEDDGTWEGKWTRLFEPRKSYGGFTLDLPAGTAALVEITAR